MDDLYQLAKAPGIDLEGANKYYLQLRAVGVEAERVKEIIAHFANTIARSGGGGVEFERVNRQLVQMLANGRVLESELKWMKESMPELAKIMQATFGTTTAKGIRDAGISAEEFVTRLTAAMAGMPRAKETLTTAIENTTTAWLMLKASLVDTDAVKSSLQTLTSLMEGLAGALKTVDMQDTVSGAFKQGFSEADAKTGRRTANTSAAQLFMNSARSSGLTNAEIEAMIGVQSSDAARTRDYGFYMQTKDLPKEKSAEELDKEADARDKAKKDAEREAEQRRRRAAEIQEMLAQQRVDAYNAEQANLVARRADKPGTIQRGASALRWSDTRMAEDKQGYDKWADEQDAMKKAEAARRATIDEQDVARMTDYLEKRDRMEALYSTEHEREIQRLQDEQALILDVTTRGSSERERLLEEHYRRVAEMQRNHVASNMGVFLDGHATFFDSLADLTKNAAGEQSNTYKTMFAVSKGFAIASASLNLSKALMDALAQGGTIWEKMAAYGTVAAMGGNLISQINSAAYSGVFDKGGDIPMGRWGIAGENGPEIIQGPAHVTSTKDTAKLLGNAGGTNVVINNYSSATISKKSMPDGTIALIIKEAADAAEDRINAGIAGGGGKVAQTMQNVYGLKR